MFSKISFLRLGICNKEQVPATELWHLHAMLLFFHLNLLSHNWYEKNPFYIKTDMWMKKKKLQKEQVENKMHKYFKTFE